MADEEEWKKLATEDKVQHTSWKARAEGYKECLKKFPMLEEKSPEFSKYLGLVKKFVTDTNELNRVQGMQATLVFVENAAVAGKTCADVVSGIVLKCFNTKPRLRESGIEVCLMYIEIDKNELVQEEIMKGFENKQPKIVHACLDAITTALKLFGSKVITIKPLIKQTIKLLDHRDKNVREATKNLFVEIYRWIGPAIRAPLQNVNAVVLKDLEDEWEKIGPGAQAKQTRFMRSQQDLREKMEAKAIEGGGREAGDAVEVEETVDVDPYELLEPVEILSKLPKNFFTQIEEKKWQERKMALEACEKLTCENPKLAQDDYGDLVKVLKKVLSKDTNILLVVIAVKCIGGLARGLRKKFHPYALSCLDGMFERFKEKKPNVVSALQDAVDAIYLTTNIQAISEMVVEALGHKNPSIRCQVGLFLSRSLSKTKASAVNKALMKLFVQPLCKNIDHSAPDVRDSAFQATGTLWKLVGEAKIHPFLADLDKLKLDKISEFAGKADVKSSVKNAPSTSNSSQSVKSVSSTKDSQSKENDNKKKSAAAATKVQSSSKPKKKVQPAVKKSTSPVSGLAVEQEISDEIVGELVLKIIGEEERGQVLHVNWKERLAGLQATFQKLRLSERSVIPCQAFIKFLSIKPGWKDTNFNCLIERFKILSFLAENGTFSRTSCSLCLQPTIDKIGDVKCGASAKAALTAMSEAAGMPWVAEQVLNHAMSQKNPKIQSEAISWLSQAIRDFGPSGLNVKMIIEKSKVAIAATNPGVRTAAFTLIGTLALYIGEKMRIFFEGEKSAVLQQIDAEMEKVKGQGPPAPCRGVKNEANNDEEEQEAAISFDDMVTRVDISVKITEDLINKINDKNWKIRKEGLDTVVEILNESKFISATIGDLLVALKARLSDSNKLLVTLTLGILTQLSTSLGPHTAKHIGNISSSIISTLADSKPQVRQAAVKCMNTWLENSKLSLWLEGDTIATALSSAKQAFLRTELFIWLTEKLTASKKLPANAKEGLELCVPTVFACCEDRSGDVRAKAQALIPALMRHLSFDKLLRATGKLSAGSKTNMVNFLEKAREQMPAPATTSKAPVVVSLPSKQRIEVEEIAEPAEKPAASKERKNSTKRDETKKRAPPTQRKAKTLEEDSSPMFIKLPNGKEQRMKDEAKLKTIKWHFNTPREELVVQLQQQMTTCVGASLLSEMFHADFQHHIKAISMLQQALSSDWESTVACIDLILRWFTLRFYDKNTTVHIKSLEYLKSLFEKLIESDYRMSEYEASAFLPHFIIKIGENKDNIRKAVQGILKQVSLVYSASKLFVYIMDGIKSKNSRQRSECLDQIGLLIETYGVSVCQPNPGKALKEVASNISDRDKSVRLSALNAIVAAYNVSGDIVFKQVGKLNEKDMSMLEERIKRSGKFTEGATKQQEQVAPTAMPTPAPKSIKETKSVSDNSISKSTPIVKKSSSVSDNLQNAVPSSDDEDLIPEEITKGMASLQEINIDHLLTPIPMPEFLKERGRGAISSVASAALDVSISQIASTDLDSTTSAMHELFEVLKHKDKHYLMQNRVDHLLTSSTSQIRMMGDRYLPQVIAGEGNVSMERFKTFCRTHFALLTEIFNAIDLASQLTTYTLFDFFRTVLPMMISDQFSLLPFSNKLTQVMNILVIRTIDNCDPTAITCAIIKLLTDSMESGSISYYEIAIKCLWKVARIAPDLVEPELKDGFRHQPLKVSKLLSEVDRFWTTYPRHHEIYTRLNTDVPLRSMKSVVLNLAKRLGPMILDELTLIPNPHRSDVVSTIQKFIGSSANKSPMRSSAHKKENISGRSTVSLEMKLSGIFKKIGDRQLTKQGLVELYEFKQEHPRYNVDAQIEELEVEFFRDYVKRGVKKIEDERLSKGVLPPRPASTVSSLDEQSDKGHFARLNQLRANCGLEPLDADELLKRRDGGGPASSSVIAHSKVLAPSTDSLNHPKFSSLRAKSAQVSRSAVSTTTAGSAATRSSSSTSQSLLDIKRRLEQIKQSSARR